MEQKMTSEKFWLEWLKISLILTIIGGMAMVLIYYLGMTEFINKKLDIIFLNGKQAVMEVGHLRSWMISITGAVMTGWGLTMLYVVNQPFRKREKWAWNSIFYPMLLWFLVDSSVSAYYGVAFNIIINMIFFLQMIAPLLFLRPQFYNQLNPAS
jgi:hypothetical protein